MEGDKLSNFKNNNKGKFNKEIKKYELEFIFSKNDKKILNFIYYDYRIFGYDFNKIHFNSFCILYF